MGSTKQTYYNSSIGDWFPPARTVTIYEGDYDDGGSYGKIAPDSCQMDLTSDVAPVKPPPVFGGDNSYHNMTVDSFTLTYRTGSMGNSSYHSLTSDGVSLGSRAPRQLMVPTPVGAHCVNYTPTADREYMTSGSYINEG